MRNQTSVFTIAKVYAALLFAILIIISGASTSAAPRYLSSHSPSQLWLKEGSPSAPWIQLLNHSSGVYSIESAESSNRIAFVDGYYRLWVKEGGYTSQWTLVANNVYQAELVADKIFVIDTNFNLNVKVGSLQSGWLILANNVYTVQASPNRVVALSDYDGYRSKLIAKEGSLYSNWVTISYPISYYDGSFNAPDFSVTDNRIAFFDGSYDNFSVKEGGLLNPWYTWVYGDYGFDVELYGSRICINFVADSGLTIACKEGSIFGSWITVNNDAYLNEITDTKITATRDKGGGAFPMDSIVLLEGTLYQNSGWLLMDIGQYMVLSKY